MQNKILNKVYWYFRKEDGHIFPVDNEKASAHMHYKKNFNEKFVFIGTSSGKHMSEAMRFLPRVDGKAAMTGDVNPEDYAEQSAAYRKAYNAELMEACLEGGETPRDMRRKGLNGQELPPQLDKYLSMEG